MNILPFLLCAIIVTSNLHAISNEERLLLNAVKQSHGDYLLEDYLNMTPEQRKQKEQSQFETLNAAMTVALNSPNIGDRSSLLAELLLDQDVSEHAFSYIVAHRNAIGDKQASMILHWYISSITGNEGRSNAVIRNIIFNFQDPKLLLPEDSALLEDQILRNEHVNIIYLLYWPHLAPKTEQELIKIAKKANHKGNIHKWRRSWLALCILAKFNVNNYAEDALLIASKMLATKDRQLLIYIPLGLALTNQKKSIEFLAESLNSDLVSKKTPDAEPSEVVLAQEAACVLGFAVEQFPQTIPGEKFDANKKRKLLDWLEKNSTNIMLTDQKLDFFLKHTKLGVF